MPYFLYKVLPGKKFERIGSRDSYRAARDQARELRKALSEDAGHTIKIMFAKDPDEAERLMAEERQPRPLGEDA